MKEVQIVLLEGHTLEEIESKASRAVSAGGTIIGFTDVTICSGARTPAMVIIRKKPVPVPGYDTMADPPGDDVD